VEVLQLFSHALADEVVPDGQLEALYTCSTQLPVPLLQE